MAERQEGEWFRPLQDYESFPYTLGPRGSPGTAKIIKENVRDLGDIAFSVMSLLPLKRTPSSQEESLMFYFDGLTETNLAGDFFEVARDQERKDETPLVTICLVLYKLLKEARKKDWIWVLRFPTGTVFEIKFKPPTYRSLFRPPDEYHLVPPTTLLNCQRPQLMIANTGMNYSTFFVAETEYALSQIETRLIRPHHPGG